MQKNWRVNAILVPSLSSLKDDSAITENDSAITRQKNSIIRCSIKYYIWWNCIFWWKRFVKPTERKDFSLKNRKSLTKEELATQFKKYKCMPFLVFLHDDCSISNQSHIMMMVSCICDDKAIVINLQHYTKRGFLRNFQSITDWLDAFLMTISSSILTNVLIF